MKLSVVKGATSVLVRVFLQDSSSTTGAGLSGLTSASGGLVCYRARDDDGNAAGTAITLSAGTLGTWSSGGFAEKDATHMKGVYEFGVPNAALATGSRSVLIYISGATNLAPCVLEIELTGWDNQDGVHGGLTALPNTACTGNASLLTSGTGTDQISVTSGRIDIGKALGTAVTLDSNNVLNVSAKYLAGTACTGRDIGASVLLSAGTGTGQLDFTSGVVKANATQWLGGTIPAVNVTGVPLVDAKYLLGTVLATPATAGIIDVNLKNVANAAVSASTAQLGVNVVNWSGSAVASPNTAGVPVVDTRNVIRTGTAQATGNSTTAVKLDSGASATTDFYKYHRIIVVSGTGAPQSAVCTAYNGSTKVATVSPAWPTAPDNTSVFIVTTDAQADVEAWEGVAPNALQSGRVDAYLGATGAVTVAANVTQVDGAANSTHASGMFPADLRDVAGAALNTSSAQIGVNVVNFGGSAGTFAAGRPEVNTTHFAGTISAGAAGYVGPDWGHVNAPTTVVALSGTTISTVTTVTNQLTAAAVATGVWQDATAGDFTVASSIGKALYIANVAPGGSGGHMISGTNSGTTTLGALTVTGATTCTGNVSMAAGLTVTQSTANAAGVSITGNGSGAGLSLTGGAAVTTTAAGPGMLLAGGAASTSAGGVAGNAVNATGGAGAASTNGAAVGVLFQGGGTNTVASTATGLKVLGASTGHGLDCESGSGATGDGLVAVSNATAGNGVTATHAGTGKDLNATTTPLTLAKTTNITGFNDIAATAVVSSGAITTSGGAVSTVTAVTNGVTLAASQHVIVDSGTVTTVTNQLTAAQIATGVWQDATAGDFTVAGSIGKSLFTSGAAPGTANGLFIAGTNAATAVTTSFTTTFTGNLTGSVGSVTGAVGSVTGAVGSVTGAVGSVTGNVAGNVTGSVGSVIAAVTLSAADSPTLATGTAAAGGATTIALQTALGTAADPVGCKVKITSGTGANQERVITGYVNSTKVATVNYAWVTNPDATSVYAVLFDHAPKLDSGLKVSEVTLADTLTTYTGNTPQTGDSFAVVKAGGAGDAAAIKAKTDNLPALPASTTNITAGTVTTVSGNVNGSVGSVSGAVGSISGVTFPTNFGSLAITAGGVAQADLQTIKTQAVTCAAGVTVLASVGTAATSTAQTGDSFARIGATGGGLTSLAPASTALSTTQWTNTLATNLGTLAGHDPGATLGTSTLTQAQVTGGAYSVQSASCVLGDVRVAHLDADVSSRMATYTQPAGFLAATFPTGTVANTTNITAGTITTVTNLTNAPTAGDFTAAMKTSLNAATPTVTLAAGQHVIVDSGTVTTLTNLPAIPANWLTAAGIAAAALNGKGDWSTYAGGDTSGTTTLLARIPGTVQPQTGDSFALIGTAGAGLTALAPSSTALSNSTWTNALAAALNTLAGHDPGGALASHADAVSLAAVIASLQSHGDVTWATATGFALAASAPSWYAAPVDTSAAVAAVRAQTDRLAFTVPGLLDANVRAVNGVTVKGTGVAGDTWGPA